MLHPDQQLAATLRRLRYERGLTQEALAFHAQVTISALSRIERGLSSPVWTTLVRIADALGVTPSELVAASEASTDADLDGEPGDPSVER
jgi:transcriptional regulator with XRE-family HTH domain